MGKITIQRPSSNWISSRKCNKKSSKRMGGRRSGSSGGRGKGGGLLQERANMSFMLVVMFFVVFGLIVLTEIFLIDEKGVGGLGTRRGGGYRSGHRIPAAPDRPDYDQISPEDYVGLKNGLDDHLLGMLGKGDPKLLGPVDPRVLPSLPTNLETRLPHPDAALRVTHAEWLPVTNTRFKFFVYSAYYDDRLSGGTGTWKIRGGLHSDVVRVIGATKTRNPDRVWCRLWYPLRNSTSSITVPAKVKPIRENWNLKYSASFIICPLPKEPPFNEATEPESVSVVAKLRAVPANRLRIQNRPGERPRSTKPLAVCVKPLHYDYNRVLELIEFVQLYRILGATKITLYNDTIGPEANCVLQRYEELGHVQVLPWHGLEMVSQREIRTECLFAALNDCLYRSMYEFDYVALLDLDEFIIPRHDDTILDLISWMSNRVKSKNTGAYSFQNAFFYLQWPDDPYVMTSKLATEAGLITLRKTRRRAKLHPHKQRSKYICNPRAVFEAGNHFVWEFAPGYGMVNVPQDAAILHHYRVCEFGGDDCVKTDSVVDRTAYRYLDRLAQRVDGDWTELSRVCDLPAMEMPKQPDSKQTGPGARR